MTEACTPAPTPIPGSGRATVARVAGAFGLTVADLTGPRRWRRFVQARNVAAWVLRQQTEPGEDDNRLHRSFLRIGALLGGRDHTSIIHAVRQAELAMQRSPDFALFVRMLASGHPPVAEGANGTNAAYGVMPPAGVVPRTVAELPARTALRNPARDALCGDDHGAVGRFNASCALAKAIDDARGVAG